jgi:hypothetical protein
MHVPAALLPTGRTSFRFGQFTVSEEFLLASRPRELRRAVSANDFAISE